MSSGRVLGIDACRRGWIGIAVEETVAGAYFAEDVQELISRAEADGPLSVVAIDMPIGLADRGFRRADVLARAAIGPLWSSVFMTPVREALLAPDHATASAINRALAGQGVSIQAFGLKPKLLQVERAERRRALLADAGLTLTGDLGGATENAGVDDVLDAAVAAWTARRVLLGHAQPMPNPPETFSDGWPCAIWS